MSNLLTRVYVLAVLYMRASYIYYRGGGLGVRVRVMVMVRARLLPHTRRGPHVYARPTRVRVHMYASRPHVS